MIARVWHGYTSPANADAYEQLLRNTILPGIHRIQGYQGAYLLRRPAGDEVEFITVTFWQTMDAVRAFAGEGRTPSVVPEQARRLLAHYEEHSVHYDAAWCP